MKGSLLLYIHGFNSSPKSLKANIMKEFCQQNRDDIKVIIPQMPCFPQDAKALLAQIVEQYAGDYNIGLVGSSLGGYYSTWLNHVYGLKAVVVNPAVRPYELLLDYLSEQTNPYTNESYILTEQHIDDLKGMDVAVIQQPEDFWLLQQKGDELLDYRQAVSKYQKGTMTVEEGGDHSFIDFERFPAEIIRFLGL